MGIAIKSFGHFLSDFSIGNTELAARFNVTEDWILEKTGIESRKYYTDGGTSDLALQAALQCLAQSDVNVTDVECIIVATMTPDHRCPSTASLVHQKLGANKSSGFDLMAACSGFIYALELGASLIQSRTYRTILVCGADKMSSCIDPNDRKTAVILGDGAGVCLLQFQEEMNDVIATLCRLDSTYAMDVSIVEGSASLKGSVAGGGFLKFNNHRIFDQGVRLMHDAIVELVRINNIKMVDVDYIVPHQANKRMIEALAQMLNLPIKKFIINIDHVGNTSAASIPIAISEALQNGTLLGSERLLLCSVGAGFTYAAALLHLNLCMKT